MPILKKNDQRKDTLGKMIVSYIDKEEYNATGASSYIVLAIEESKSDKYYYIFNDFKSTIPHKVISGNCVVVDSYIPEYWKTIERSGTVITSYNAWCDDEHYLNYIIEDTWQPEETKLAVLELWKEHDYILNEYIKKRFGSFEVYVDYDIEIRYKESEYLQKIRGYEYVDKSSHRRLALQDVNIDDVVKAAKDTSLDR